jgi:mannose-6-phosphate isomerase-like protein (cupin superfamily)
VDPTSGFKIDADSGERITFSGAEFIIRASSDSTGGVFGIVEEIDPLDTPLHVHKNEDEFWYVLEGEHVVQVGDNEFHVGPGEMAFGPRGVPHSQRRVVPRTGRFLVFILPGGFEGFFRELAEAESSGSDMPEAYARVSEKYGITWSISERWPSSDLTDILEVGRPRRGCPAWKRDSSVRCDHSRRSSKSEVVELCRAGDRSIGQVARNETQATAGGSRCRHPTHVGAIRNGASEVDSQPP